MADWLLWPPSLPLLLAGVCVHQYVSQYCGRPTIAQGGAMLGPAHLICWNRNHTVCSRDPCSVETMCERVYAELLLNTKTMGPELTKSTVPP